MKILLIDDHALFRDGVLLVLEGLDKPITSFEAGSYESAKSIIDEQHSIDLVLLDLGLPGISNLDALLAIKQQLPNTPIVVLSGTDDPQMIEQALQNGAKGYIPKSSSASLILSALQLVISGGIYIPPEILLNKSTAVIQQVNNANNRETLLSPRQCEVLYQLADGKSNIDIGDALNLSESTVRTHVAAILRIFSVKNRTQAVQYAIQHNWIKITPSD